MSDLEKTILSEEHGLSLTRAGLYEKRINKVTVWFDPYIDNVLINHAKNSSKDTRFYGLHEIGSGNIYTYSLFLSNLQSVIEITSLHEIGKSFFCEFLRKNKKEQFFYFRSYREYLIVSEYGVMNYSTIRHSHARLDISDIFTKNKDSSI